MSRRKYNSVFPRLDECLTKIERYFPPASRRKALKVNIGKSITSFVAYSPNMDSNISERIVERMIKEAFETFEVDEGVARN